MRQGRVRMKSSKSFGRMSSVVGGLCGQSEGRGRRRKGAIRWADGAGLATGDEQEGQGTKRAGAAEEE